jgi:hypothetical protein
MQNTSER